MTWNLHLAQQGSEYDARWTLLRYMVSADFHWHSALIEGMEGVAADLLAGWQQKPWPDYLLMAGVTL